MRVHNGNSRWTGKHRQWLRNVKFENAIVQETLSEYLATLEQLCDKVERLDKRIEEFSRMEDYAEKVNKLVCFKGIRTHTAMSLIVETSDFRRFPRVPQYAALATSAESPVVLELFKSSAVPLCWHPLFEYVIHVLRSQGLRRSH